MEKVMEPRDFNTQRVRVPKRKPTSSEHSIEKTRTVDSKANIYLKRAIQRRHKQGKGESPSRDEARGEVLPETQSTTQGGHLVVGPDGRNLLGSRSHHS